MLFPALFISVIYDITQYIAFICNIKLENFQQVVTGNNQILGIIDLYTLFCTVHLYTIINLGYIAYIRSGTPALKSFAYILWFSIIELSLRHIVLVLKTIKEMDDDSIFTFTRVAREHKNSQLNLYLRKIAHSVLIVYLY